MRIFVLFFLVILFATNSYVLLAGEKSSRVDKEMMSVLHNRIEEITHVINDPSDEHEHDFELIYYIIASAESLNDGCVKFIWWNHAARLVYGDNIPALTLAGHCILKIPHHSEATLNKYLRYGVRIPESYSAFTLYEMWSAEFIQNKPDSILVWERWIGTRQHSAGVLKEKELIEI